jgi:hypothetical protein
VCDVSNLSMAASPFGGREMLSEIMALMKRCVPHLIKPVFAVFGYASATCILTDLQKVKEAGKFCAGCRIIPLMAIQQWLYFVLECS